MSDEQPAGEGPSDLRVGERLRLTREQQQLTVEDIAARSRIPRRHLAAIEASEYASLPAPTYSAGFVKTYARMLGLDAQPLSDQFRSEMGVASVPQAAPAPYEPADPRRTPPIGLVVVTLVVAVLLVLGYLYWRGSADEPSQLAASGPDQPAVTAPPAAAPLAPVPSAPVAAAPAPTATGPIVIGASQDVWVKVSDGGKTLHLGILKAGERYVVPPEAVDPMLTTGRPGSTTITVGATPIPTVGDPDRIAKGVSLKAASLLARVATPAPTVQPAATAATPVENTAGPQ